MTAASTLSADAGSPDAVDAQHSLLRTVLRSPRGLVAVIYLVALSVACAFAHVLAPYDPLAQHLSAVKQAPSGKYWLGTDTLGRDVLSRLLYGGGVSLVSVLEGVAVLLVVGVPLGLVAGYVGGLTDKIITRVADLVMSLPVIILLLAVLTIFDRSLAAAMVTFGVLSGAGLMRLVRGSALATREELYVAAAKLMGLSGFQIMTRHVLSRCRGVIIVQTSLFAAIALGIQTGLTYLSLGPPPPAPTWGGMVGEAASVINQDPWLLVPSGGLIAITVVAFGILGDVVRDATADKHSASGGVRIKARRKRTRTDAPTPAPDAAGSALLSVRDLCVSFTTGANRKQNTVVDAVSFDIAAGETVGLVGESGSGKSVTARAIIGLLAGNGQVTSGRVDFDGTDLTQLTRREYGRIRGRRIAMISQEPMVALDPSFTVGSQLAELARVLDGGTRRAAKARALELLRLVEIPDPEDVARRYPHQISGGMAQRVAIAMALTGRPELLIADEPTTALDVTVQADILDLLRTLQRDNNMAILLVTHDWGVVADLCSRVVVMYAGQVVERAEITALFAQPLHPYTRALLDSSPEKAERGHPIVAIPGTVPPPQAWPVGCHFQSRCSFVQPDCAAAPIPVTTPSPGRTSRCLHIDKLLAAEGAL